MNIKNLVYALSCLSFSIIIGAATYEHLVIWSKAFAAPPSSLTMFQGEYGVNGGDFWSKIHPITILLLILTLIMSWKSERRKNVLITLIGYVIILVATAIYFVPELIAITTTEYTTNIDPELQKRGSTWEILSWLREVVLIVLSVILYLGLTKNPASIKVEE